MAGYYESVNNLAGARDVLATAFRTVQQSYYLGDRLGQLLIRMGDLKGAKEIYQQVSLILKDLREQNVWTYATALSAAIVCEDQGAMADAIRSLQTTRPSRGDLESIERGMSGLTAALERDSEVIDKLREIETRQ
jgi:hypothetical protein